ncbi:MAG: adenylate/guanylate cyclase domain-containing protein [Chlamydiae bacterium]|nr:adenylate/guanylate cyclase domain-containing protein [Chlamydiota bacterium]MBI3277470.1 adenylate/guanylate cyclase domain-containing protein [Chlamydiota bacterium]
MSNILTQKWVKIFLITLFSFLIFSFASHGRLLRQIELKGLDVKFAIRGFRSADSRVFLIGIDDPSLQALGRWPWPRSQHAALLQTLSETPPSALGFDILFTHKDESNPEADQALIQMSRLFDGLVYAAYFVEEKSGTQIFEPAWKRAVLEKNELPFLRNCPLNLRVAEDLQIPFQELSQSVHLGFINAPRDEDGSVRRIPLIFRYRGRVFSSFALRLILDHEGLSNDSVKWVGNLTIRLDLKEGFIDIPVDSQGNYFVNYRSSLEDVHSTRFAEVLRQRRVFKSAMGVVGVTATGVGDSGPTPISSYTPFVMVHLNAIQNILQKDFLKVLSRFLELCLLFIVCFLTTLISYGTRSFWAALGALTFFIVFTIVDFFLFMEMNWHLPWVVPSLAIFTSYLMATTNRFWIEEKEKRFVKKAFRHYVSGSVMEKVLKDPKTLALGGKREDLTVLFSDIRQFSSYCERNAPETVVSILNEYFDAMTEIIFKYGGTLDKYLGDGMLAIFGAPLPLERDHALCAVEAAFEMQKKLKGLHEKWIREGWEPLSMGVGINTGPMVVGNMGSSHVMNYTVIGDQVNLAARIEGLTRQFNVEIIISEATYQRVSPQWLGRSLGEVKVKGREKGVSIYAIEGRK